MAGRPISARAALAAEHTRSFDQFDGEGPGHDESSILDGG